MIKIDHRKNYYVIIDTETCPIDSTVQKVDPKNMLVYDVGIAIIDKQGDVLTARSYVVNEIFYDDNYMNNAYYADKLSQYYEEIEDGLRIVKSMQRLQEEISHIVTRPYIKGVVAHNAIFDLLSLNNTWQYLTGKKYFFPYGTVFYDTLKMARQAYCGKAYKNWCNNNGYLTKNNQPRYTAEILYRYISGIDDFAEAHIGIEDVMIEKEIFAECMKKHISMKKELFNT